MRYLELPLSIKRLNGIHFQHREDQVVVKLPLGKGNTTRQRAALVKSVLTAITIYHIMLLIIPVEVLQAIDKIHRAFLWAGSDKVSGG